MLKASFVIPSHNCATWLPHAIESCQKQSYLNIEIVVVDDASTDSTWRVLDYMATRDRRIKALRNEKNLGRSESRNIGNAAATGDFIFVLDADDIAYADRVKHTLKKLERADFVYGAMDEIDCIGNRQGTIYSDVFNLPKVQASKRLWTGIVHSSCAYSKKLAMDHPYQGGDFAAIGIDDWRLQVELAAAGAKFDFLTEAVGAYRQLSTAISKTRDEAAVLKAKQAYLDSLKVAA